MMTGKVDEKESPGPGVTPEKSGIPEKKVEKLPSRTVGLPVGRSR
jgi:hypothetical protein